jgi:transposase
MTLVAIGKKKVIRDIARSIGKSIGTIQAYYSELEMEGLITAPPRRMKAGRTLTEKGLEVLKDAGLCSNSK